MARIQMGEATPITNMRTAIGHTATCSPAAHIHYLQFCNHLGYVTVEDALNHPQHVGRAQDDAKRGRRDPGNMAGETAAEDEKLTHKPVQQRKADQRERADDKQSGQAWHLLG